MTQTKTILEIKQYENSADLYIYGVIDEGDISAQKVKDELNELNGAKEINVHLNSPGGSVFEGIAIYNLLKQNKARINVYVDALAASIASVIAMAGDVIFMPSNSMMMIHNPYMPAIGNADELRKAADSLEKMTQLSVNSYLAKADGKVSESELKKLMDNETWLSAEQAVGYGLADEVIEANQAVAFADDSVMNKFKKVPKQLASIDSVPEHKTEDTNFKEIREKALQDSKLLSIDLENIKEF